MRMSELLGERYKEKPADCTVESHALMVRGGYIKQVNTGVYTLLPPGKRITTKIERIIREEMDRIGGQEVLFPVVLPADLWKESGRFTSVGKELVRLTDRWGADMVLGMTHEEAAVHLARDAAKSYAKYPFMIYQIQTKFRDEPRARGGLIRVREFTMKDAYSFHTSQADLEAYYARCYEAYERIFKRAPEISHAASRLAAVSLLPGMQIHGNGDAQSDKNSGDDPCREKRAHRNLCEISVHDERDAWGDDDGKSGRNGHDRCCKGLVVSSLNHSRYEYQADGGYRRRTGAAHGAPEGGDRHGGDRKAAGDVTNDFFYEGNDSFCNAGLFHNNPGQYEERDRQKLELRNARKEIVRDHGKSQTPVPCDDE